MLSERGKGLIVAAVFSATFWALVFWLAYCTMQSL